MNGAFYSELGSVAGLFEQWGACERTVVACALARRVPWPGLRLLQRAVEAALAAHGGDERLERDANDETVIAGLLARPDDDDDDGCDRLHQLLTLLPLLRTDNERAKEVYMCLSPALVQRCVDAPRRRRGQGGGGVGEGGRAGGGGSGAAPDLCRQLLSYLLVHPALTQHDQATLTQWLRYLENHISGNRTTESVWQQRIDPALLSDTNIWTSGNTFRRTIGKNVEFRGLDPIESSFTPDFLQESFSKNGRDVEISLEGEKLNFDAAVAQPKSQRSNSLTPPSTNFLQMSLSAENLSDEPFVQKPRSFSLSSEHSLSQIRPISVMYGTTGSETRLDELKTNNCPEHPGMSTVAQWLKSLRLHKYVWLFTNISYEQMMAIDEKSLEKLGVTKGARHKILVSIQKLSERESILRSVQSELTSYVTSGSVTSGAVTSGAVTSGAVTSGAVGRALERLRGILLSPMPPSSPLPHAIVAALELASKCINVGSASNGRLPVSRPVSDEDPAPPVDPLSLHCWLVERALHHESFVSSELQCALRGLRHRLPPRQFFSRVCDLPHKHRHQWRNGGGSPRAWCPPRPRVPPTRPKSHSYPPCPCPCPPPRRVPPALDYSSLDALCLQMTEQAIN